MRVPMDEVLERAGRFFMGRSPIHEAALRITKALDDLGVPFAIAGALCANAHGHRRTTEDVDILITPEGLATFKARWLGRGWVERFPGSRGLRDTQTLVPIDVLLTGGFPGDGRPKPVSFPDPALVADRGTDGLPVVALGPFLELKLASGMTAPHRPRDLDDVIQVIRAQGLAEIYAEQLDPYVRDAFRAMWRAAQVEDDE